MLSIAYEMAFRKSRLLRSFEFKIETSLGFCKNYSFRWSIEIFFHRFTFHFILFIKNKNRFIAFRCCTTNTVMPNDFPRGFTKSCAVERAIHLPSSVLV